jgi:FHS family L-fucose permease-like MFS transporter
MPSSNKLAVSLIISLFFLWGLAHNMNPILIPHLKKACQLSDLQSAFIDSAFYIGYFVMALPAGYIMKRVGYKGGILIGLVLFALGAFLFYPAAIVREYSIFLAALFIIASGLTFLETAANPYITVLGEPATAVQRLNFAQSFNGLAATLAPFIGGLFILSGNELSDEQKNAMAPERLSAYLDIEAATVKIPYLIIGLVVLLVAIIIYRTKLPDIIESEEREHKTGHSIWKEKNLLLSVMAQFFYVGAQVCVGSFFIRFAGFVAGIRERDAAMFLSAALLGFMVGRFFGTFLMKYISPSRLLLLYGVINILLLVVAINTTGVFAVYCLVGVEFFMSIMFPTIFSLGIRGLGNKTKEGSSLLIMSIVGGAILPVIMGRVSDVSNIQNSYIVPCLCFIFIVYFAWMQPKDAAVANTQLVH